MSDPHAPAAVRISQIVAVARNGVIGRAGALPWRVPSDLRTFKRLTMGKPIVMGRKTFESIGKPLPGRPNIVITRQPNWAAAGVHVAQTVPDAIAVARDIAVQSACDEVMIIGGAEIYRASRDLSDRIYLTRIDAAPDGDTWFDPLDPDTWSRASVEPLPQGPKDEFAATLEIYDRKP